MGEKRGLCIHEVLSLLSGLSGLISTSSGMFMISPTENVELIGKVETGVSRLPKEPIRAPFPSTWDVPATEAGSGDGTSLLGFLSAISASTLKGRIGTFGFPVSPVGLKLVCISPLLTRTERGEISSAFKPAARADMDIDGAIQGRPAPLKRFVTKQCRGEEMLLSWCGAALMWRYPHVCVAKLERSSYNKADVDREAANQGRRGLDPEWKGAEESFFFSSSFFATTNVR